MEPPSRQTAASGWLIPREEEELKGLRGWRAEVLYFFRSPHGSLVLRFTEPGGSQPGWFLFCVLCQRLQIVPRWIVDGMRISRADETTMVIEEAANSIRIECYTARFFDPEMYAHWVGSEEDEWRTFPTLAEVKEMLRQTAGE